MTAVGGPLAYPTAVHDGPVACAPAQVAIEGLVQRLYADWALSLLGLGQGRMAGHDESWGAVPALRGMLGREGLCAAHGQGETSTQTRTQAEDANKRGAENRSSNRYEP